MKINIINAIKIYNSKKDFIVYTVKNNKLDRFILTNDLTQHRKKFGMQSEFSLLNVVKDAIKYTTINL